MWTSCSARCRCMSLCRTAGAHPNLRPGSRKAQARSANATPHRDVTIEIATRREMLKASARSLPAAQERPLVGSSRSLVAKGDSGDIAQRRTIDAKVASAP